MNTGIGLILVIVGMMMVLQAKKLAAEGDPAKAEKARWLRIVGAGFTLGAAAVLIMQVADVVQDHDADQDTADARA